MTCDFTSFSTVFQTYQDDGVDNEKLYAPFTVEKISPRAGSNMVR